ncbi:hypothetical protein L484_000006 [Morus notabilis]|uniref:Uncharacterized protein n=1 Tax=Morus notabilis TaxID=981085 RepID=W9SF24_9ROSA|nr:hypothetical protein L484_000006 [Morus notabilis]
METHPSSPPKKTLSSSSSSSVGRPLVKVARWTSSGRIVSLSRDDDLDMSGQFSGQNDYINYTVMMPPTPDNQPVAAGSGDTGTASELKPDSGYGGGDGGAKMDRRMSVLTSSNNKSMLLRTQTGDFDHNRWLFETKGKYGIGNAYWSPEEESYGPSEGVNVSDFMDKPWKPLTRKVKVPSGVLSPYRCTAYARHIICI